MRISRPTVRPIQPQWKPLRVLNLYRIGIALLFLALPLFPAMDFLGRYNGSLYVWVSLSYILVALSSIYVSYHRRPGFALQVYALASLDILAITLLMYSSGGIASGLGMLMIVAVAGTSLLVPGRTALFFAALGSLALLLEEGYAELAGLFETTGYSQAGMLGAALFTTALLAVSLAKRAKESAELAERRGLDLANMTELNEHIVNRMSRGIIVVDEEAHIRLMNRPAWELLGAPQAKHLGSLQEVSQPLYRLYQRWGALQAEEQAFPQPDLDSIQGLQVRITRVGARKEDRGAIIYLEDAAELNRRIQETKLASLGRLTASIAHEIRNPLGAISHAAQLLGESPALDKPDRRLVGIITDQSKRMNEIIQNILQLSRKEQPKQELIPLGDWLADFIEEFSRVQGVPRDWAALSVTPDALEALMDPNHLHQVLWNLCANAIKYGTREGAPPAIEINATHSPNNGSPQLDVVDHGPGIEPDAQASLFEPFFTTSSTGTGLGLYISRQLCQNNGGELSYHSDASGGSCFRLRFPRHKIEESQLATRAYR